MTPQILFSIAGLLTGALLGFLYGRFQANMRSADAEKQKIWGRRGLLVGIALVGLFGVQILFPGFFVQGARWWLSGGIALGYAGHWTRRIVLLRRSLKA